MVEVDALHDLRLSSRCALGHYFERIPRIPLTAIHT